MKVVDPSPLLEDAAGVLVSVKDSVVVIGAVAVEVALDSVPAAITPTRDVDLVVGTEQVEKVIRHLEDASLKPSEVKYERGFTWVRGDLKVQLIRGFHPFPPAVGAGLPVNPTAELARDPVHREAVAFVAAPDQPALWVANAACLIALKQHAFGRTRPTGDGASSTVVGETVRRDFHDVYSLIAHVPEEVVETYEAAGGAVRERVRIAVTRLAAQDDEAVRLAAAEMVALGESEGQREAEATILRGARMFEGRL